MAHNHGNEYQIKIIRENGIEELSGWMSSMEQVAQAMLSLHKLQGTSYWLLVRNILCSNYSDSGQTCAYPVSTIHPTRLPLSAGSGVKELVRLESAFVGHSMRSSAASTIRHEKSQRV